jgi:hypothetical protein
MATLSRIKSVRSCLPSCKSKLTPYQELGILDHDFVDAGGERHVFAHHGPYEGGCVYMMTFFQSHDILDE